MNCADESLRDERNVLKSESEETTESDGTKECWVNVERVEGVWRGEESCLSASRRADGVTSLFVMPGCKPGGWSAVVGGGDGGERLLEYAIRNALPIRARLKRYENAETWPLTVYVSGLGGWFEESVREVRGDDRVICELGDGDKTVLE